VSRGSGITRGTGRERSFSDAEAGEDPSQDFIGRDAAEHLTKCIKRFAKFERDDFRS
jgi:hypothetical protein